MMRRNTLFFGLGLAVTFSVVSAAHSHFQRKSAAAAMVETTQALIETLDAEQKKTAMLPYGSEQRVEWHFIPKDHRKGLQMRHMTASQRKAAVKLLRSALSQSGFKKARGVMKLEGLLAFLEKDRQGGPLRDAQRYYFTIFGTPGEKTWGLSFEGHHISLNYVLEGDKIVSSTPAFFAANPGVVMNPGAGVEKGTRILADEEVLAFELINSLSGETRDKALIAEKAPREIRAAGEAQPPQDAPEGVAASELTKEQSKLLQQLIMAYASAMPREVAKERLEKIEAAGPGKVYFGWAGATKPGVGHYYRVQGPSFLIEFVNTQPDAAGNPANHIHCVWRDMAGDFALPIN